MRTLKNRDAQNSPLAFVITWLMLTFISMLLTLSLKAQDYQKSNKRFSPKRLTELHKKEDAVLEKNNLPKPTSDKHEEVRKLVADKLNNKKDIFPLNLPPLYFTFDQDEFSIVDMEPFLIAAEYAL